MTAVWEGRWAEMARRIFAKRSSTELNAIDDLMPVIVMNDPSAEEFRLSRRERLFEEGGFLSVGGAGRPVVVCHNVPSSTVLMVIEQVVWAATAASSLGFKVLVDANPIYTGGSATDGRGGGASFAPSRCGLYDAAGVFAGIPGGAWTETVLAAAVGVQQLARGGPYVVAPGQSLFLIGDTIGTSLTVNVRWSERNVDTAELSVSGA